MVTIVHLLVVLYQLLQQQTGIMMALLYRQLLRLDLRFV